MRPFINDKVTIGKFKTKSRLSVVDLRRLVIGDPFRYESNLNEVTDYIQFMHRLGRELSRSVSHREADIEYLPTQYLSEFVKRQGYDGIVYGNSMLSDENEFNVVIFNDDKLECVSASLYEVTGIKHDFRQI